MLSLDRWKLSINFCCVLLTFLPVVSEQILHQCTLCSSWSPFANRRYVVRCMFCLFFIIFAYTSQCGYIGICLCIDCSLSYFLFSSILVWWWHVPNQQLSYIAAMLHNLWSHQTLVPPVAFIISIGKLSNPAAFCVCVCARLRVSSFTSFRIIGYVNMHVRLLFTVFERCGVICNRFSKYPSHLIGISRLLDDGFISLSLMISMRS